MMRISRALFAVLFAGISCLAAAADLTFNLKINRGAGAEEVGAKMKAQTIAVFVIDCSGSMSASYVDPETGKIFRGPSGKGKAWSRAKLVAEKLLPERFEALPPGTRIFAYLYSMAGKPWVTGMSETLTAPEVRAQFLKKLQRGIYERVKKNGATPYYDTMDMVLTRLERMDLLNDPGVDLMLFDYTDGLNATGNVRGLSYPSDHTRQYYSVELAAAKARFNSKWGVFLKRIAQKGFYEPLNVGGAKDNPEVKRVPAYRVALVCDTSDVKSPREAAEQEIPLYVFFPVNQGNWKLLLKQGGRWAVKIRFGNGPVRQYRISPGQSAYSITVPIPADAMNKATSVTISFDCPRGVPDKFMLLPPAPVRFYLPVKFNLTMDISDDPPERQDVKVGIGNRS